MTLLYASQFIQQQQTSFCKFTVFKTSAWDDQLELHYYTSTLQLHQSKHAALWLLNRILPLLQIIHQQTCFPYNPINQSTAGYTSTCHTCLAFGANGANITTIACISLPHEIYCIGHSCIILLILRQLHQARDKRVNIYFHIPSRPKSYLKTRWVLTFHHHHSIITLLFLRKFRVPLSQDLL